MKYHQIEIYHYKAFKFSNIRKLTLDTDGIIQVIIGANGSGKSSLLREITPLPANRPDYENNDGYKKLILTHEGSEYVIMSDFSNRAHAHSFVRDGKELNESGTSTVQEDLVRTYLGYTKRVEEIVTGKHLFATMPPGVRRNLLMSLNPFEIEFLLDKHKAVMAQIRACKSNLVRLHERKADLESTMLSPEVITQLEEEREGLSSELDRMIEYLHRINESLRSYQDTPDRYPDIGSPDQVLVQVNRVRQRALGWGHIDRADTKAAEAAILKDLTELQTRLPMWDDQIATLVSDIDKYTAHRDDLMAKASQTDISKEIVSLEENMHKLKGLHTTTPFPESILPEMPDLLVQVREIVNEFMGCTVKLVRSSVIQRKQVFLSRRAYELSSLGHEIDRINARVAELTAQQVLTLDDIPTNNCAKMVCPLYATFVLQNDRVETELMQLKERQEKTNRKINRLQAYVSGTQDQLDQLSGYTPQLIKLFTIFRNHPHLKKPFDGQDILHMLQVSPVRILKTLEELYEQSVATYQLKEMEREHADKKALQAAMSDIDAGEVQLINDLLTSKAQELETLHLKQDTVRGQIQEVQRQYDDIQSYQKTVQGLSDKLVELEDTLKNATAVYDKKVLLLYKEQLEEARASHLSRVGKIDHTLESQKILQARYNSEVVGQIDEIEKEKGELSLLEAALSPNNGIPHRYTVRFLNALIATMNRYIEVVFSYPFELLPLDEEKSIDYKFSAQAGDVVIPDISTCSEAQREMINFAFMMACIKQRNLVDYPIFLDEIGRAFDFHHKHQLLNLFNLLIEEGTVQSMFLVNHVNEVIGGLPNADVLVLNDLNIMIPSAYNDHVTIQHGY